VFTTDATMEALTTLLSQNPRGLLCVRDELAGWLRAMDPYRAKGDDRQKWLAFWSGACETVHRQGAPGPLLLRDPFVCVTGCLLPDLLPGLADERGRDDGFIHRILFAYPHPVPVRWNDLALCPETVAEYHAVWEELWKLDADETGPKVFLLTPDAQRAFADWYDELRVEMEEPLFPANLRGPWAKMEGYCARLALILQLCRCVAGEAQGDDVDRVSVEGAIALIDYFRSHARRVYARLHATREDHQIPPVLKWIAQKGGTVTLRELLRGKAGGVKNKTEAGRLLHELEDRGYGTLAKGERKDSLVFRLTHS
jgi:hypothetical protein